MNGGSAVIQYFKVSFPNLQEEVTGFFIEDKTPKTSEALKHVLNNKLETTARHAMYTGKEISLQIPETFENVAVLRECVKENLTCFPTPGDILFTYMPSYAFGGNPFEIYDIGIFYGRDARTFFPMGWMPGNLCARIVDEDLQKLAEIGMKIHAQGYQKAVISLVE